MVSLMAGVRPEEARAIGWEEDVDLDGDPPLVAVLRATSLDAPADRREVQSGRDSSRVAQSEEQGALCVALSDPQLQRLRRGRPVCGRGKAEFDVVAHEGHESLHLLTR